MTRLLRSGGMVPLVNIMLSEVIFGGVGSGMYGILVYIVLAVFIAGLMVGRTPEYLGKKIEAYDVKMAMLVSLVFPLIILTLDRNFGDQGLWHGGHHESWPPRPESNSLRIHVVCRKQWFGLRRPHGQHTLVRHGRPGSPLWSVVSS